MDPMESDFMRSTRRPRAAAIRGADKIQAQAREEVGPVRVARRKVKPTALLSKNFRSQKWEQREASFGNLVSSRWLGERPHPTKIMQRATNMYDHPSFVAGEPLLPGGLPLKRGSTRLTERDTVAYGLDIADAKSELAWVRRTLKAGEGDQGDGNGVDGGEGAVEGGAGSSAGTDADGAGGGTAPVAITQAQKRARDEGSDVEPDGRASGSHADGAGQGPAKRAAVDGGAPSTGAA